jgi:hypothetical protein
VQVPKVYPISRARLYQLLADGSIRSILLRQKHSIRGIRLISVASIEAYLAKLAHEQRNEEFVPAVAKELITGRRGKKGGDTERIADAKSHKEEDGAEPSVRHGRGRPRKKVLA